MQRDSSALHFDRIFEALDGTACLTLDALEEKSGLTRTQLARVTAKMVTAALIERRKMGCYQLTAVGQKAKRTGNIPMPVQPIRPAAPPSDSFRQRLWAVMRMSGTFMAAELVMSANWPLKRPEVEAGKYLLALKRAGYLIELPRGPKGQMRYRLIRNSGLLAPVVSSVDGGVYDPNTRMRQASLMPLVDPAWLDVLRAEAAKPDRTKKQIGDELGVSRTAISLLCSGTYSAGMNKVQAKIAHKVMALYGQQVWCPHVRDAIAPGTCVSHREAPMAKSDPVKLKQWLACQSCPQNPKNQKKPEAANAV